MRVSSIIVINANTKLQERPSQNTSNVKCPIQVKYHCNQCEFKATTKNSFKTHNMSVHENVKYHCNNIQVIFVLSTYSEVI